jgi:hypothetical protein
MTIEQNHGHTQSAAQYLEQEIHPDIRITEWNHSGGKNREHFHRPSVVVCETVPHPMAENTDDKRQQVSAGVSDCFPKEGKRLSNAKAANKCRRKKLSANAAQPPSPRQGKQKSYEQLHRQRIARFIVCPHPQIVFHIGRNASRYHGDTRKSPGQALQVDDGGRMGSSERHIRYGYANYMDGRCCLKIQQNKYSVKLWIY